MVPVEVEQQRTGANKLYSLHAPGVECICNGKAHKCCEFGVNVGVVASRKKPVIVAANALPGRPEDGRTLMRSLAQATLNTGIETAVAAKGYSRSGDLRAPKLSCQASTLVHPQSSAGGVPGIAGQLPGPRLHPVGAVAQRPEKL